MGVGDLKARRKLRLLRPGGQSPGEGRGSEGHSQQHSKGSAVLPQGRGVRRRRSALWSVLNSESDGEDAKATVYCSKQTV